MASAPIIRPAERRDLEALGKLGALLVRVHHDFDPDRFLAPRPHSEEGYAWFLGTQLDEPEAVVLVAELDGTVVGYVYAGIEPASWKELRESAGFIHDVVVEERARKNGVAALLMETAADWLEARGAPRILLWTAEKNEGARQLFERLGFRRTMIEMTRERKQRPDQAASTS